MVQVLIKVHINAVSMEKEEGVELELSVQGDKYGECYRCKN